ncbi:hypothetical protein M0657_007078 [Pyricularia oryzae]|uniref:Uncharacterized protein n=1 Tax=Pyricularia oryzae TaxID=318829 RepID=A0A4V1C6P3_PYROR|nr:hypothetical protein M0657_007078 [Pyricularia oryzae]QBZ60588.1 hypothetical protein PoMZ_07530 [Pyricularia oryzae]
MANSLLATDSSHGASVDLSSSKSRHQASKFNCPMEEVVESEHLHKAKFVKSPPCSTLRPAS